MLSGARHGLSAIMREKSRSCISSLLILEDESGTSFTFIADDLAVLSRSRSVTNGKGCG
jgi:hypothetical protein